MANRKYSLEEIVDIFTTALDEAQAVNTFTRSIRLQKEQIESLSKNIALMKGFKYQAIEREHEYWANKFFLQQCMLSSLRASLECWVFIKNGEFEQAWSTLIDAQEYCSIAIKIERFEGLDNLEQHLKAIEIAIFPGWAVYNSIGMLETIGKCSICNNPFNDCDHIEDEIYMGKLCRRVDRKIIEVNHTAMVTTPYDRRCIFTHLSIDGEMVDNFTREPTGDVNEDKEAHIVKARLMCLKELDLD